MGKCGYAFHNPQFEDQRLGNTPQEIDNMEKICGKRFVEVDFEKFGHIRNAHSTTRNSKIDSQESICKRLTVQNKNCGKETVEVTFKIL